jgi:hypothetical protein
MKYCPLLSGALSLVSDLAQWTVDDVKAWLLWTLRQYNLPMIHVEYFNMDGVAFSVLSEEEFQKRAPEVSTGIELTHFYIQMMYYTKLEN